MFEEVKYDANKLTQLKTGTDPRRVVGNNIEVAGKQVILHLKSNDEEEEKQYVFSRENVKQALQEIIYN